MRSCGSQSHADRRLAVIPTSLRFLYFLRLNKKSICAKDFAPAVVFLYKANTSTSQFMKQILCLAASLLALNLTPAFGQPNSPMPAPPLGPTFQQRLQAIQRAGALQNEAPEMTKFNLDFPGGPPELLVKAIEKAMGKPLNVIIPTEGADVELPPLKMNEVVVPQLFAALGVASRKITMVQIENMPPGHLTQQTTSYGFNTADGTITDTSVWYFHAENPVPPSVEAPQKICQYYSVSPYLDRGFTVDDITTAIQTGWKMADVKPTPELSYHKETKMLIAFGEPNKLETIKNVLNTLPTSKLTRNEVDDLKREVKNLEAQVNALSHSTPVPLLPAAVEEKSGK